MQVAAPKIILLVSILFACLAASAEADSPDAEGHQWWQHAVFYEIYPRSFADSDNDGIGDLPGIASKLDYLSWLGVDALWLTPCYPSPQVDFGYDVSGYENIDPMYGTLADFDNLEKEAEKRNIRLIMDFVINHTSDQHPWFIDSRASRQLARRDWYIWRDGKQQGRPPNNWASIFGGSAWAFDSNTGQYYYHAFYPQQPDLNWRNPAVRKAMFDVTRWWYKRGVAGFRLDAVDTLFEDPKLRDNPLLPGKNALGDPNTDPKYNRNLPELHDVLRDLRKVADHNGAVLIGETWTNDIGALKRYYGEHNDEVNLPMDFMFATVNKLSAAEFRKQIQLVDDSGGWPVYVFSNHDIRRMYDRYGEEAHNDRVAKDRIAKLMASLYLTLRGTAIMYYGEEIGMENNDPKRLKDVKDPIGRRNWPKEKGRDGERTPMQWNASLNAGFSSHTPWLPVDPQYKTYNVAVEKKDPASILNYYRQLLRLRHSNQALAEGKYLPPNENDPDVLAFLRTYKGQNVLVILNMSGRRQLVKLDL
ncbi:MAG: alpha-glucosidase, partial [Acidobacteriales bacterium]|nr:alpha-glucosidase [Terriglobales bacterium]